MVRNEPNWSDVFYDGSLVNLIRNMDFGITEICNYLKNKTRYGLENERSFLLSFLPSILLFILLFDKRKNIYRDRERYICSWDVAIPIFWISNIFVGHFASIHVSFLIFFSFVCFHFSCLSAWTFFYRTVFLSILSKLAHSTKIDL